MRVWLASNSARRAEWLSESFSCDLHCKGLDGIDESTPHSLVSERVKTACRAKLAGIRENEFDVVILSDTLIEDPDDSFLALGKPNDEIEAAIMLHRLSDRRHKVWSSTIVVIAEQVHEFTDYSVVEFSPLSDEVLIDLVTSESWKGKAGGYDMAGAISPHISLVEGEEVTVLGLAVSAVQFLEGLLGDSSD